MSYKYSTGSVRRGDIYFEDDTQGEQTYIDFGYDTITLRPSGSAILFAEDDAVGIGTTNPQTTLHVKGDPGQFRVEDTTVDYAYTIDCDGDGIRTHFGDMTGGGDEDSFMSFGAYTGINRLDTAARDFHIYGTNTTTGFYFDESAGKFGIGTTTPSQVLDVAGNIRVADNGNIYCDGTGELYLGNTAGGVIRVGGDGGTSTALASFNHLSLQTTRDSDDIFIKTGDATTTRLFVEGDTGNIAIGTAAPGSTLDISGSVSFNVTSFGAAANIGDTHYTCIGNCGPGGANGSMTLTLPSATDAMSGRVYVFKRADTGGSAPGGSALVVDRNSAYIDGGTDNLELGNGDCITIQCVGQSSGWIVLGNYVPI